MNSNTSYPWHRAVQDAVDENNENQVETKIQLAEFAIFAALGDSLGTGTEVAQPTEPSAGEYLRQRVFSYQKGASRLSNAGSFSGVPLTLDHGVWAENQSR